MPGHYAYLGHDDRVRETPTASLSQAIPDPESGAERCLPLHVGVVMDGNRRWARSAGLTNPSEGHRRGADHIEDLLGWCESWDVDHLSVYVLSADNIRKRPASEVSYLFGLLTKVLPGLVERAGRWSLHVAGDSELLPADAAQALKAATERTAGRPAHLTLAIGYDGRADIVGGIKEAIRSGAVDVAGALDPEAITAFLPGGPVKEIDLVIRTSGEHRLSGFFPWQTAHAEIYLSPKLWPDFNADDFATALDHYSTARARITP